MMASDVLSPSYFEAQYGALAPALPGRQLDWLQARRETALACFSDLGLPGVKLEDWKYTNLLRALRDLSFAEPGVTPAPGSVDQVPSLLPAEQATHRLVFVDGNFSPALSALAALPKGAHLTDLATLLKQAPERLADYLGVIGDFPDQAFFALNTALMSEGTVLLLDEGVEITEPIEIVYLSGLASQSFVLHPRLLVVLGANSRASIIEHFVGLGGDSAYFMNAASEIAVGPGAKLDHLRVQAERNDACNIGTTRIVVARDGLYDGFSFVIGAALSRHEVLMLLEGEGAEGRLNGAYLLRGRQHADATSVIEHRVPRTTSRETYKGAVDGSARAVFQGRIVVMPHAQQSDGRMLNKTLLLSEKAEIDSKPELEIFADDVQCAHGATAGEIDADALFYLRTRGLSETAARTLLVKAFVADAVALVPNPDLRQPLTDYIRSWLTAA
jgi:Fe-S cluster assembly protein SufD